jgi:flagellar protein FliS
MTSSASEEYLRNAVLTATPEQLHLMLYDGAIRFVRQGREAMKQKEYDTSCEKFLRAQKIVTEMKAGLRPEVQPELCEQLTSIYNFVYWRLVEANLRHDHSAVEEALQILEYQRETWRLLVEKVRQGEAPPVSRRMSTNLANSQPTLCVQG